MKYVFFVPKLKKVVPKKSKGGAKMKSGDFPPLLFCSSLYPIILMDFRMKLTCFEQKLGIWPSQNV